MCSYTRGVRTARNIGARHCPIKGPRCQGQGGAACAPTALLGVVKELQTNPDLSVDLEGYTDPTGTRDYNVGLSQRRVESVRRYLIGNGADIARVHSVGLGALEAASNEHAKLRRVTVRLMVNPTD